MRRSARLCTFSSSDRWHWALLIQGREREEEELGNNQEPQEEGQQDGRQRDIEVPESPIALTPVSSPRTPPPPQHDVPQLNIDVEENERGNIFWKGQTEEETTRW
ncbi:hypothetical protein GWK47_034195 [Chionoecetes opilio]|uniref:Uncharacterized protein n=1 Tax=Chionoecetes opilio TaxID=41210 RepID=A0A8J4YUY7_CHIOP|nr:hypothetical protein GWK47_034195 [Chionoecetes opilio]